MAATVQKTGRMTKLVVKPARPAGPGPKGYPGSGNGSASGIVVPQMWRGTSVQICGLFPFTTSSGTPMVGAPLGPHLKTGTMVCFDPISWFTLGLISNPAEFVLGLNGRGKSTLVRHQLACLAAFGIIPIILGDLKPDYVDLIRAFGGQVIVFGPGRGGLNVLDSSQAKDAVSRLAGGGFTKLADEVKADSLSRRASMITLLVGISRGGPLSDQETTLVERGVAVLDDKHQGIPVLSDLLQVIVDGPQEMREIALDDGDDKLYAETVKPLRRSLTSLIAGGRLGTLFAGQTAEPMRRDRPVCFDISSIPEASTDMAAAALLSCWSEGFGVVNVAHALADAGLEPDRQYCLVQDELWRAVRAGHGMVDRLDSLTRLNRTMGTGQIMITHTISDLLGLPDEADQINARGMIDRAGAVLMGPLPASEMPLLNQVVPLSFAEQSELISWSGREAWSRRTENSVMPGRGQFMIKVGGRPGIPLRVALTDAELGVNDTNQRWHNAGRIGAVKDGQP